MDAKRGKPIDEEANAAEVLAQRRELNRQAQKRFRERAREAKKAAAAEALARHHEKLLAASASYAAGPSSAVMGSSSQSESHVWLPHPAPRQARPDAEAGLDQTQDQLATAMYGPSTLQPGVPMQSATHSNDQRQAASRLLGQGSDAAKWGLRDASTSASAVSYTPWASERPPPRPSLPSQPPQRRTPAVPYVPPASHDGLYSGPDGRSSSGSFNIAPSLPPIEAVRVPSAWYNLLEENLQPLDGPLAASQSTQPAKTAPLRSAASVRSVQSSLSAAVPISGAVAGVSVGQTSADGASSSSASAGNSSSPEPIETIGSHVDQSSADRGLKSYEYADVLQASKAWRRANPLGAMAKGNTVTSSKGFSQHRVPGDGSTSLTAGAQKLLDDMLSQIVYIKDIPMAQFNAWLEPTVVRAENFAMPQTDFLRASYRNAILAKRGREQIDDLDLLSDIAASWSLSETSETAKPTGDVALDLEREWHTQRWRGMPKNLWPTKLQLEITHHPWIDFGFVWAAVRDRILTLLQAGVIDEDELCADIFCCGSYVEGEVPFRIWGTDTSDPMAWEIGEKFAQKWHFLFDEDIIKRSNWWREQRKLHPIRVDGPTFVIQ